MSYSSFSRHYELIESDFDGAKAGWLKKVVEAGTMLVAGLDLRGEHGEGRKVSGRSFSMVSG